MDNKIRIIVVLALLSLTQVVQGMNEADLDTLLTKAWKKDFTSMRAAVDKGEVGPKDKGTFSDWPLIVFAWADDTKYVGKLLDAGANPDVTNNVNYCTALHYCSQYGCLKTAACLIEHGAKLNLQTKWGETPLTLACSHNEMGIVGLLLAAKADPNIPAQYGSSIFYANNNPNILKQLLDVGVDVNSREKKGGNTILSFASQNGSLGAVRLLLDGGAKINEINRAGRSALMEALMNGHYAAAEALLDAGADWQIKDADGNTAVFYAANLPAPDLVGRLAKLGANTNDIHLTDLHLSQVTNTARLWPYAITAMQMVDEHLLYKNLEGLQTHKTWGELNIKLVEYWGIHSKDEATDLINEYKIMPDSTDFAEVAKQVAGLSDQQFAQEQDALLVPDPNLRKQRQIVRDYLAQGGKRDLIGWEAARYIHLLLLCRANNSYLSEKSCWTQIEPRLKLVQDHFASWDEFAKNVLVGYAFHGVVDMDKYALIERMLLNKADPASPWNKVSWKTELNLDEMFPVPAK